MEHEELKIFGIIKPKNFLKWKNGSHLEELEQDEELEWEQDELDERLELHDEDWDEELEEDSKENSLSKSIQ